LDKFRNASSVSFVTHSGVGHDCEMIWESPTLSEIFKIVTATPSMADVTLILSQIETSDPLASERLLVLV